jgi:2-amino-4-hydroxy-6-hydroxymethyldihydropteridine diphosphokinase
MRPLWVPAYVAVGSNLDDPRAQVEAAFEQLAQLPDCRLMARSPLYRSAPLGPQDQPEFVNAAVALLTMLEPSAMLRTLKALEQLMGRGQPIVRWGPRRIDLDLVVYGDVRIETEQLQLPHPGVPSRNFVLYPLSTIAPDLWVPGYGRVRDLAGRVTADGLQRL